MKRFGCGLALVMAAKVSVAAARPLDDLRSIPGLEYSAIVREFSKLLDDRNCAVNQDSSNIRTHMLFVKNCRDVGPSAISGQCKSFDFQINNASSLSDLASGPRFIVKGSGRWCRTAPHTWSPAEPDILTMREVMQGGPSFPEIARSLAQPPSGESELSIPPRDGVPARVTVPAPVPTPTVMPVAPAPELPHVLEPMRAAPRPSPPPPKCESGYKIACEDFAKLLYLTTPDASDEEFERAIRMFLSDEREDAFLAAVITPRVLEKLAAAAIARSTVSAECPRTTAGQQTIAACGVVE